MARRRHRPALYELIRRRAGSPGVRDDRVEDISEAPPTEVGASWLSPGRTIRIPVGYLFLTGAAVLLVVILVYMVAYRSGHRAGAAEYADLRPPPGSSGQLQDPLLQPRAAQEQRGGAAPGGPANADHQPVRHEAPATGSLPANPPSQWEPIESDPRQPGRYYFVLMQTSRAGALRLARFCREEGLEAYVIGGNNQSRRVIVQPGLPTRLRTDPQVRALQARIEDVGRRWKAEHRGATDLKDAYIVLFEG